MTVHRDPILARRTVVLIIASTALIIPGFRPTRLGAAEMNDGTPATSASLAEREKETDIEHLRRIFAALQAYRKDHNNAVPDWLSDLVPLYLSDTNVLVSPVEQRTGRSELYGNDDPKIHTSYIYEFNSKPASSYHVGQRDKPLTMKDWKTKQMEKFGAAVPIVRCHLHQPVLNLAFSGDIYETELFWETHTNTLALMRRLGVAGPTPPSSRTLELSVVDSESAQPLPGARVKADFRSETGFQPAQMLTADAEGQCGVRLEGEQIRSIQLEADGLEYISQHYEWSAENGQPLPTRLTMRLLKGITIGGIVQDPEGRPIAGVLVSVPEVIAFSLRRTSDGNPPGSQVKTATTDADGQWSIRGVPKDFGLLRIELAHPDYRRARFSNMDRPADPQVRVTSKALATGRALLRLKPRLMLTVSVVDAESQRPVRAFNVVPGYGVHRAVKFEPSQAQAGSDGRLGIILEDEQDPFPAFLRVQAAGYQPGISPQIVDTGKSQGLQFALKQGRELKGTVRLPDGQAAAGAEVALLTEFTGATLGPTSFVPSAGSMTTRTDEQGRFAFPPTPEAHTLVAMHEQGYAERPVDNLLAAPEFTLQRWGKVDGKLSVGHPSLGESSVAFVAADTYLPRIFEHPYLGTLMLDIGCYAAEADENGSFVLNRVPPGRRMLWHPVLPQEAGPTLASTLSFNGVAAQIRPGETFRFASAGPSIRGRVVRKPTDRLVEWGRCLGLVDLEPKAASSGAAQSFLVTFAEPGEFCVEGVRPGDYQLNLRVYVPPKLVGVARSRVSVSGESGLKSVVPSVELELEGPKVLAPGDLAPPIEARTFDGRAVNLADYRGRYVLVHFWTTWCGARLGSIPQLESVEETFGKSGRLVIVSLSFDEDPDAARRFVARNRMPSLAAYVGSWLQSPLIGECNVSDLPSCALIDPDGRIVATDLAGTEIRSVVQEALKP